MRVFRRIVPLSALLLVSALSPVASARAMQGNVTLSVGPNIDLSRLTTSESETAVAINPTNPDNIVVVSNVQFGVGLFKAVSFDGGISWTGETIAEGEGTGRLGLACCDGTLAFDEFGNLFLSYLYDNIGNVVPVALSTDGGLEFNRIDRLRNGNVGSSAPDGDAEPNRASLLQAEGSAPDFVDQPTITAGHGMVWVDWDGPGGVHATGAAVHGLGAVDPFFRPPSVLPGSVGGSYGDIKIGPHGEVLAAYQDHGGGEGPVRIYANLDPDGLGPARFHRRWLAARSGVGGFDYIPAQKGRSVDAEVGLAWDTTAGPYAGRVYLVYTDERPNESNNMDILLRTSDNQGHSWSDPVRVNDDTTTNSQFLPKIALDPTTGLIAIVFHDSRLDKGRGGFGDTNGQQNNDANFVGTVTMDGGRTFVRNVLISEGTSNSRYAHNGIDYGDYTGLDFFGGVFFPAWADNSNSAGGNPDGTLHGLDIYTARVAVSPG